MKRSIIGAVAAAALAMPVGASADGALESDAARLCSPAPQCALDRDPDEICQLIWGQDCEPIVTREWVCELIWGQDCESILRD